MAVSLQICAPLISLSILLRLGSLTDASDATAGDSLCDVRSDGEPSSCTINCFRPDPVCGANGVTYWCGCPEAACAGAHVAKRGPYQVGNGGTGVVSGQFERYDGILLNNLCCSRHFVKGTTYIEGSGLYWVEL